MTALTTNPVLIVDDEQNIRLGFSVALRSAGFEVATAASGDEAIAHLEAVRPDCVLLDLRMPGMNGLQTAERLRELGYRHPIVLASAFADHATAVSAIGMGITDFLAKPIKPTQLRYAINHAISRHHRFAAEEPIGGSESVPSGLLRAYAKYCLSQRNLTKARTALSRLICESNDLQGLLLLGAINELEQKPQQAMDLFIRAAELHARQAFVATSNELFKVFSHAEPPTNGSQEWGQ